MKKKLIVFCMIAIAACNRIPHEEGRPAKKTAMTKTSSEFADIPRSLEDQLAFTCTYEAERIPPRDPEADQLFKHARWLYKRNRLKNDPTKFPEIERLYRISAAWGHDKANHNLALMMIRGQSDADDYISLPVTLAQNLIKRGIPQGYYDMGVLLSSGYGVKGNDASALQYMRKAADLGNPDAQYHIGNVLFSMGIKNIITFNIGRSMIACSAEQGNAQASFQAAIDLKNEKNFSAAVHYYHLSIKNGKNLGAFTLSASFLAPPSDNTLDYLGLAKDEERSRRYAILSDFLHNYSYLNPTVEDIDEIVPLPPAKLPPWDGKPKWLKEWESGKAPPLPSEERLAEMAEAKGLAPKTGRPVAVGLAR
ncbi:sel1 repeat family protein [Zoogloea sp.]|uniref:SEL1-like repeat protein n=1 Tax=Zoogloea sp. TaxID=49181 RepID=UPI0035B3FA24